jgi:hypothetical protein
MDHHIANDSELSLREVFQRIRGYFTYLRHKWLWIAIFTVAGLTGGYFYTVLGAKKLYSADIKFLVNGGAKSAGNDPLAALGLASATPQTSNSSDIFEALDISYIMTSSPILERTLLSRISYGGKEDYVVNFFIRYKQKEKGLRGRSAFDGYNFYDGKRDSSDLSQNQYVRTMIREISSDLKVEGSTSNALITASFKATDPLFPKYFLEKLIAETSSLYTYTKTAQTLQNIRLLEHQADSVRRIMGNNIASSAYSADIDPNSVRPNTVRVGFQKKQVDNSVLQSTYQTLASSLVNTRIELGKQTPFIQVYERPIFPLALTSNSNATLNMLKFGLASLIASIIIFSFIYAFKEFKTYLR